MSLAGGAGAYHDPPPPAHPGGFGEPTCATCHRGADLDAPGGSLELVVPARHQAGEEYVIEVRLVRSATARAGFALSARFAEGEVAGRQAGELATTSPAVRVVAAHDVSYAGHTAAGSSAALVDGGAEWRLRWRAPGSPRGPVVFHLAVNAGNDDDSELGDFVYLATALSRPATPPRP